MVPKIHTLEYYCFSEVEKYLKNLNWDELDIERLRFHLREETNGHDTAYIDIDQMEGWYDEDDKKLLLFRRLRETQLQLPTLVDITL